MASTMEKHQKEENCSKNQSPEADCVQPVKCPVVIDDVPLNGPTLNVHAAEGFINQAMAIIMEDAVKKATDVREKVCEWCPPEQLKELLDLELRDRGEAESQILQRCRDAIRYSVKTTHPRFFNQLYAGMEPYSMVASFVIEALKPSLYTYEVAPVFTLMEEAVLRKMMEMIGWEEGGDGIFNAGGSMSNMYAVNLARYHHCPDIKELGLSAAPRLVMFTSQECHYSISKAAALLGIGTKNVYVVPSDKRGKMIPSALEELIKAAKSEGALPFMVNATAGTTVLGAFDPIEEIADICEKHDLWLHVDACWGGAALMSKKHKHLLKGIHRANSVAWNPHKMLMACLQCSAFLVRDKTNLLQRCHSAQASYLFQQDKFYDVSYDTGDKSVQCSRKPDAFKFWLMWKALGASELEQRVDRALAMARYLAQEIKKREGFRLLMEPEYANICFWYIPPSLRNLPDSPELWKKLHTVAPVVKERMMKRGSMMVGYQPHGDKANFFRMIIISPQASSQDMDFVLDEIHNLGKDL
ncbi:acidic amino acid decarboxylase GADL1-like isoform X1 [Thunnus maccoyii]|uniref:acidic amino acid decarboxylase GADL1-like isoform X1 n=2 Tax=Thunnus maccoyii TaxID=8240 RepID=UPI001C4AE7FA|nr:acidic amino acid decarboxylase GADL1-like isoform X1 [Thunnus maccoyii]XP_042279585.1 acidic amino acid decarboxylase GADL1-like isoform X1 [Thunnus maccoyii]XP_042279586.1 acidic amino acid decarboxylase GADL1-like isoform X1 [Thunnus maccoyii]